jgi:hypothetical protein
MPIAVLCPGCEARLNAPDTAAGKTVKCPKCQAPMVIPAPDPEPEPEEVPRRRPAAEREDDRPRKKRRPVDDEDEDDDHPRRKGKRKPAKAGPPVGLLVGGGLAALLLLVGGGFAAYWFGFRDKGKDVAAGGGAGGNVAPGGGGDEGGGDAPGPKAPIPVGWKEVAPPGWGFKMYVPRIPTPAPKWELPPARASKPRMSREVEIGRVEDEAVHFSVRMAVFPDGMAAADAEKFLLDELEDATKDFPIGLQAFVKRTTRKATLGGKPASELRTEMDVAGLLARSPNLARQFRRLKGGPPDRVTAVWRYCVNGGRGYVVNMAWLGSTPPPDADARGFFDNFEFVPVAGPGVSPKKP